MYNQKIGSLNKTIAYIEKNWAITQQHCCKKCSLNVAEKHISQRKQVQRSVTYIDPYIKPVCLSVFQQKGSDSRLCTKHKNISRTSIKSSKGLCHAFFNPIIIFLHLPPARFLPLKTGVISFTWPLSTPSVTLRNKWLIFLLFFYRTSM